LVFFFGICIIRILYILIGAEGLPPPYPFMQWAPPPPLSFHFSRHGKKLMGVGGYLEVEEG